MKKDTILSQMDRLNLNLVYGIINPMIHAQSRYPDGSIRSSVIQRDDNPAELKFTLLKSRR